MARSPRGTACNSRVGLDTLWHVTWSWHACLVTCQCFRGRAWKLHTKWTGIILSGWLSVAFFHKCQVFFSFQKKRHLLHTAFRTVCKCPSPAKKWMLCEDNTVLTNSMRTVKGEFFLGSDLQSCHFNGMKTTSRFGWTGHRQAARWLFFLMPVWFQLQAWRIMQKIYEASVWVLFGVKPLYPPPIVQKNCTIQTSNKSAQPKKTRFPSETFFFASLAMLRGLELNGHDDESGSMSQLSIGWWWVLCGW